MTATSITNVMAWQALDSRGRPTVACRVRTEGGGEGRCIVPSGASTGTHEAVEHRDGGPRHGGYGVSTAVRNVNTILREAVLGVDAADQVDLDATLESMDSDPTFAHIGANAVLSVSLAGMLAAADTFRVPLYAQVSELRIPMPMINMFSGGAHAGGAIDIQDLLVVPAAARTFAEAIELTSLMRRTTADLMRQRGFGVSLVADEGGLSAPLRSNREALELVTGAIESLGLRPGRDVWLAIDIAANQLADGDRLTLRAESRTVEYDEWLAEVESWVDAFPICSIEDILPDGAWDGWARASAMLRERVQLLGDDLFVTNTELLARGVAREISNAVLVKLNQAGTVSRARAVVDLARRADYATVISARSGDTEDHWLADLSVAWDTGQIKVGSVMRSERTAKWNRLLEIEAETGARLATFSELFPMHDDGRSASPRTLRTTRA